MTFKLPQIAETIIEKLSDRGHFAFAFGKCVRDALIGANDAPIEIASNASPLEITKLFSNCKIPDETAEMIIVSIKNETAYIHVSNAKNENELIEQIKNRFKENDFTAEALICNTKQITDCAGGEDDATSKITRTIGDAKKCCIEKPETILKALVYMSKFSFTPCDELNDAIRSEKMRLKDIQKETALSLFNEIMVGKNAADTIRRYTEVIAIYIPQILDCVGFEQKSKYHCFDVLEHTLKAIESSEGDLIVRTCLLFHDLGKPATYTFDGQSGHFHGHNKKSAEYARAFLLSLNADAYTLKLISTLVYVHDMKSAPTQPNAEKLIAKYGLTNAKRLLEIQRADILAHHPNYTNTSPIDKLALYMDKAISENKCVSIKQLAISGHELNKVLKINASEVGAVLRGLLYAVIDGNVANEKQELMRYAETIQTKKNEKAAGNN